MGVCLSREKNKYIKSKYIKDANSNDINNPAKKDQNKSGYTFIKYLKSLKNLSDIENRLSKLTRYEDINIYYSFSSKPITENEIYALYHARKIDSPRKEYNYVIKKVLKLKDDDQINITLIKEIKINMMMHHENIVKCYEIFEDDLAVYFIYEYMPKGDLFNYILKKRKHRLKDKKILNILEQMLMAMVYLHEKVKVIHRDIKPSNFLIKKDDKKIIVKLKDFDSAEFIKEEGFKYLTKGTPLYIAPEVYLDETYDEKIDMWGIGITLYYMITGINPFQSDKNNNVLKQTKNKKEDLNFTILEEDKITMQKILNQFIDFNIIENYGLRQLTQHLLERNPHKRYSALEALEELNKIKSGVNLCVSKTMKETPVTLKRIPSVFEGEVNRKTSTKLGNKFKNIYNRNETMNNLNNKIEENDTNNENNEDISEFSEFNNVSKNNNDIINNNEIKIVIMKKKK